MATRRARPAKNQVISTSYISQPVPISDNFLTTESHTGPSVTYSKLDFSNSILPEFRDLYAVILDNVLTPEECNQLIHLAEQSTGAVPVEPNTESQTNPPSSNKPNPKADSKKAAENSSARDNAWQPALVNAGYNREFLATDYRNSDRIIWDEKTIVARLWARCLLAPGLHDDIGVLESTRKENGKLPMPAGHRWLVSRLNERMRFLRYGPGQFFREHCDGTYMTPDGKERTWYTLHLYLNDDKHGPETLHKGGATTFHAPSDKHRRIDVNPKAGRVLIFQHSSLLHSGDTVVKGIKYTMRSDILFTRDDSVENSK